MVIQKHFLVKIRPQGFPSLPPQVQPPPPPSPPPEYSNFSVLDSNISCHIKSVPTVVLSPPSFSKCRWIIKSATNSNFVIYYLFYINKWYTNMLYAFCRHTLRKHFVLYIALHYVLLSLHSNRGYESVTYLSCKGLK